MEPKNKDSLDRLSYEGACNEAYDWITDTGYSLRQAWQRCRRGDWMLWWAGEIDPEANHRRIVKVACQCARLALRHVGGLPDTFMDALLEAEAWAKDGNWPPDARTLMWDTPFDTYAGRAVYYAVKSVDRAAYGYMAAHYAAMTAKWDSGYDWDAYDEVLAECATLCRREWRTLPDREE